MQIGCLGEEEHCIFEAILESCCPKEEIMEMEVQMEQADCTRPNNEWVWEDSEVKKVEYYEEDEKWREIKRIEQLRAEQEHKVESFLKLTRTRSIEEREQIELASPVSSKQSGSLSPRKTKRINKGPKFQLI